MLSSHGVLSDMCVCVCINNVQKQYAVDYATTMNVLQAVGAAAPNGDELPGGPLQPLAFDVPAHVRSDINDEDSDTMLHTPIFDIRRSAAGQSATRQLPPSATLSLAPAAAASSASSSPSLSPSFLASASSSSSAGGSAANSSAPRGQPGSTSDSLSAALDDHERDNGGNSCKICHCRLHRTPKPFHMLIDSDQGKTDWIARVRQKFPERGDEAALERSLTAQTYTACDGLSVTYWLACKPCERPSADCATRHDADGKRKPGEPEKNLIEVAEREAVARIRAQRQPNPLPESDSFRALLVTCLQQQFPSYISQLGNDKRTRMLLTLPIALVRICCALFQTPHAPGVAGACFAFGAREPPQRPAGLVVRSLHDPNPRLSVTRASTAGPVHGFR